MKVSVVIPTKNRVQFLTHCLGSLAAQSVPIDELIVVDNQSADETAQVVRSFAKNTDFPIRLVSEKGEGYPRVYNRGLEEAQYPWIAFIDDDCVADADWLKSLKECLRKHPQTTAVLGESGTQQAGNTFALLTVFFDQVWKKSQIRNKRVLDCEILDNKNIAYNRYFLKKHGIAFDEKRGERFHGACEDSDLGMQLQQAGGTAVYCKGMKIWHYDPNSLRWYYWKLRFSAQAHAVYEQKWESYRSKLSFPQPHILQIWQRFLRFRQEYRLSFFKSLDVFFHLAVSVVLNKLFKF